MEAGNITDFQIILEFHQLLLVLNFNNNKKYYALIIGNNNYDKWTDLTSPINDTNSNCQNS